MNIAHKLAGSLVEHGIQATLGRVREYLGWKRRSISREVRIRVDGGFDRRYGTDTARIVEVDDLDVSVQSRTKAQRYEPTPVPVVRAIFGGLDIDFSQFTFVDYGSGKGRVLLLASEWPWKRIVGVEFSETLHRIAVTNVSKWRTPRQSCFNIEPLCADAAEFRVPDGPVVLFFFTPFKSPVSDQVIQNIRDGMEREVRPVRIIYYGSNREFLVGLQQLHLLHQEIYSQRPFTAQNKRYRGHLFSNG